ncbi:hypothetical protein [Pseudoponticoccus marisrubri]|uniref:DUF4157 domain-containing protein n=1 Tax=Pseudoponticoccus marisrubri TaxID=1685382 RepID=A0A0W7WKR8_9RHOB|nr:hypothetical protein [Pseudoponticoccus marisrubri]KUF11111.1 hypothetical protein AVJ23_08630 [Pseudoponticoccus marisrubri]
MRLILLAFLVLAAACGRPLTSNETAYLQALKGDQLDASKVRLHDGHFAGSIRYHIPVRPRTTCQERLWPPLDEAKTVEVSPAATVVFNTVLLRKDIYSDDMMAGWPDRIDLFQAMLLAHEAVHVWQWQNRHRTGYTPLKALAEHGASPDPYLFDPDTTGNFLDYGYEQQGSIVEEYVCCRLLDPEAPRTARLRAMISKEMPIAGLDAAITRPRVRLPWAGAETEGICR